MGVQNITVTLEPQVSPTTVSFLHCAAAVAGGTEKGYINLGAQITNTGTAKVTIRKIEISVPNSNTLAAAWTVSIPIQPGNSAWWIQGADYVFNRPSGQLALLMKLWENPLGDPKLVLVSLVEHQNPPPEHSYLFWGAVRDLRPGEFWQVDGTTHNQTLSQMFAYDVGVSVESGSSHYGYMPGTDHNLTVNENSRIWGKPIYAIADGKVSRFRNNYPTNPRPIRNGEDWDDGNWYIAMFPDIYDQQVKLGDGNGNFFTIETGDETVLYAHLQTGSLNSDFLRHGTQVKAGDFLGLAGNSGFSSGPHMHIHACKTFPNANNTTKTWEGIARPMVWRGARAVEWNALASNPVAAHWARLNNLGFPPTNCAIWPSDSPVVKLRNAYVRHMAISERGQLWVINNENGIRTTNNRFPTTGVYLDVLPGGNAREIALVKEKPYIIGMDNRLYEGRPDGWLPVPGSPLLKRISVNAADGIIWVIMNGDYIASYNPTNGGWISDSVGGKGTDICAREGTVYVIDAEGYVWSGSGHGGWGRIAGEGKAKRIALDPVSGPLWAIDLGARIKSYDGSGGWIEHPQNGMGYDILSHKQKPFVIGLDHGVWNSAGINGWNHINVVEAE